MSRNILEWLKPRSRKKLLWEIASCLLLLLLVAGGILWQMQPSFLQQFLGNTNTQAYPTIYVTQHRETASAGGVLDHSPTSTSLYAINGQSGKIQQTVALPDSDATYYQKISNGVNYMLLGSAGGTSLLLATDVHTGALLWEDTFAQPFYSVLTSPTALYLYETSTDAPYSTYIVAINLKNGAYLWEQLLKNVEEMTLTDQIIFAQEAGTKDILALRAGDGRHLWEYSNIMNNMPPSAELTTLAPRMDNGRAFFDYLYYPPNTGTDTSASTQQQTQLLLFELDERRGVLLWQDKVPVGNASASFSIQAHCLLIETGTDQLTVLRETDKSVIWSAKLQSSYHLGQYNYWVAAGDSVYGFSAAINPRTFAIQQVMTAWQIASGKKLFQTYLDLSGDFNVYRVNDQIFLTSTNNTEILQVNTGMRPLFNDIEARQAQTGRLLWHRHLGQLPLFNNQSEWLLSMVETSDEYNNNCAFVCQYQNNLQESSGPSTLASYQPVVDLYSDDRGKTTLYIAGGGTESQAVVYVTLYETTTYSTMLYALDRQTGALLWQVVPATLTIPTLPLVTFFPLPTATDVPQDITAGPDGNLWFTAFPASIGGYDATRQVGKIGRITPEGKIRVFALPRPGMVPGDITAGPDGNLWFVENGNQAGAIGRITPSGQITEFPLPSLKLGSQANNSSTPTGIVAGPDGNVWFTEFGGNKIGRITPEGKITAFALPTSSFGPTGIIVGPDGNLWFIDSGTNGYGALASITPTGIIKEFFLVSQQHYNPMTITAGPDGNLWFMDAENQVIGYMTLTGNGYVFEIPQLSISQGLARGADGNFWLTNHASRNQIVRFTPATQITAFDLPDFGGQPGAITAGPHGSLWFTEVSGNLTGEIGRILLTRSSQP